MTAAFDRSLLVKAQTRLSSTYRVITSSFLQGTNIEEKDRISLAVEIKAVCPDFSTENILTVLNLPLSNSAIINEGAPIRADVLEKEKLVKVKKRKEEKRLEIIATHGNVKFPDINEKGFAPVTINNVKEILRYLGITLKLNTFSCSFEITGLESIGHNAVNDLCLDWIRFRVGEKDINLYVGNREQLDSALKQVAHQNRYHPIKEYIEAIQWDGVERLGSWLINHAGVKDDAYSRAVSALPLMAAVKRIYEPGSKFDEMLVLQSGQGWGKSSCIKALMPRHEWFSDDLPLGCDAKTVLERTNGKWFIEAADMQNFNRVNHNQMKAFMSRATDKARMAFERTAVEIGRQWVIVGTVNDDQFLNDPTGDRRYWPLSLSSRIDEDAIKSIRDQLWAEAYHKVVVEEKSIRLDKSIWELAEQNRQKFTHNNSFKEALAPVLYGQTGRITNHYLYEICGVSVENRRSSSKLKQAMEQLGWSQTEPILKDGTSIRVWEKGKSPRWLVPIYTNGKGWEFKVDKKMSYAEFDEYTQGGMDFDEN